MRALKAINILQPTNKQRLIIHVFFWCIFFLVRFYLTLITFNVYTGFPPAFAALLNLCSTLILLAAYYLLILILWPLIGKRRYYRAALGLVAILFLYTVIDAITECLLLQACPACLQTLYVRQPQYYNLINSELINIILVRLVSLGTPFWVLLTLSIPLCFKLALSAWRGQANSMQLAKQNLQLELNFLKAQLNPHFLFNSMNNIYGLILQGDQQRSASLVEKLSGLLRYILYETNQDLMPLSKEIALLNDYIELEKVRLNETQVIFSCHTDHDNYTIAPLLLMPLIENAFKFCADDQNACIKILLQVTQGKLDFTISNNINTERQLATGGIGLANLTKRLSLYYADRYAYQTSQLNEVYTAHLNIKLA